jgi:hypothetical protein
MESGMIEYWPRRDSLRDNCLMRQLSMFTPAELAGMRDRTASRNYSPSRDEFRREHERHRAWGLARRHASRLRDAHSIPHHSPAASTTEQRRHDPTQAPSPSPSPSPSPATEPTSGRQTTRPAPSDNRPTSQNPSPVHPTPDARPAPADTLSEAITPRLREDPQRYARHARRRHRISNRHHSRRPASPMSHRFSLQTNAMVSAISQSLNTLLSPRLWEWTRFLISGLPP